MTVQRIAEFDLWTAGYGGAQVTVYVGGTTTLASIFSDIACTTPLANPQELLSQQFPGFEQPAGKWEQPVYTQDSYYLSIDTSDRTGIQAPPLTTLNGADASGALVTPAHGTGQIALSDWIERTIDVRNYGSFLETNGAADNTTTLNAAIGVAAGASGGFVYLPGGQFHINPIILPEGVVLVGARESATALLVQAANSIAVGIGGDGAGLRELVLDGVNLQTASFGIDAISKDGVVLEEVTIRRFDTGLRLRGGESCRWRNLGVQSCNTNVLLSGDLDTSDSGLGSAFRNLVWFGGNVAFSVHTGLELKAVDAVCQNLRLIDVQFEANLGTGLRINGARDVEFEGCWSHQNPTIEITDNVDTPAPAVNTVARITFTGGYIDGDAAGTDLVFDGVCSVVEFRRMEFLNVAFNMSSPQHVIHLTDCVQDARCSVGGITQYLLRRTIDEGGTIAGSSHNTTAVVAWTEAVPPNELWIVDAKVVGKKKNGIVVGAWWITATFHRPVATLAYINLTTAFTVGKIVTGATSGASALILADSAGTLSLGDITGAFVNNEVITDTNGGSARASGTLSFSNCALTAAGNESLKTADDGFSGAAVAFAANGANAELHLTGVASTDIEWVVKLSMLKS